MTSERRNEGEGVREEKGVKIKKTERERKGKGGDKERRRAERLDYITYFKRR